MDRNESDFAVIAESLRKMYGSVTALSSFSVTVPRSTVFGILGPNGAGKTTFMRAVVGLCALSSGRLTVLGQIPSLSNRQLASRIGVVPQGMTIDDDLTVRENLHTFGRYYGLGRRDREARVSSVADLLSLSDRLDDRADELSGGLQRRVLIGRALLPRPELLLLDEPTTGLDAESRTVLWDQIRALRDSGSTVIVTTHYTPEAEYLCDEVCIVDNGRVLDKGRPSDLVDKFLPSFAVEVPAGSWDALRREPELKRLSRGGMVGGRPVLYTDELDEVMSHLQSRGIPVSRIAQRETALEDVLLLRRELYGGSSGA